MFVIQFIPGLGYNLTSTLYSRWEVTSTSKDFQKSFQTKEEAIAYLKSIYGENVKYCEKPFKAIRWPDD